MKRKILIALLLLAVPVAASSPGTQIACGTSPCTITNTAAMVLNNNPARQSCLLQVVGAATLYCRKATLANSTATSSNFDFLLYGSTALQPGNGYQCDSAHSVWRGPINCIASASQSSVDLAVTESQ